MVYQDVNLAGEEDLLAHHAQRHPHGPEDVGQDDEGTFLAVGVSGLYCSPS